MINVKNALEILQAQMETDYRIAHEKHYNLDNVRDEIEIKLSFLFEIDGIDKDEYFDMIDYLKQVHEKELRKEEN